MATKKKAPRKRSAKPKAPTEEAAKVSPAKVALAKIITEAAEKEGVLLPPTEEPQADVAAADHRGAHEDESWPYDGSLLREDGDPTVYVVQDGQRRPVRDANAFTRCGFSWQEIVVLSHKVIDPIPVGEEIRGPADLQ